MTNPNLSIGSEVTLSNRTYTVTSGSGAVFSLHSKRNADYTFVNNAKRSELWALLDSSYRETWYEWNGSSFVAR